MDLCDDEKAAIAYAMWEGLLWLHGLGQFRCGHCGYRWVKPRNRPRGVAAYLCPLCLARAAIARTK